MEEPGSAAARLPGMAAQGHADGLVDGHGDGPGTPGPDARALLLDQTRHLYGWAGRAVADVDAADALATPTGGPSVAWQLGHLLRDAETTAEAVAGLAPTEPERGDADHWGVGCADDWDALRARWAARSDACLSALAGEPDLEAPPRVALHADFAGHLTTRRAFWSGHVVHLAYHLGQVGSLRARLGLGWWR